MRTIYTKYSNDRAPEYQIRTDIILKDDGNKAVIKKPVNEHSTKHVKRLEDIYHNLQNCFDETRFSPNKLRPFGDGYEFQFVQGITLEEYLDELVNSNNYEKFVEVFREFLGNINRASCCEFEPSEEYEYTFGEWSLHGTYNCMPVTNVDIIFPNIIITDEKWNVIDYEWTYDFLVPSKFVVFRAIHYYLSFGRENNIKKNVDMFEVAGITEEERQYFLACEEHFQHSLMRGYNSLWKVNDSLNIKNYYPFFIVDDKFAHDRKKRGFIVFYKGDNVVDKRAFKPDITVDDVCVYQLEFDSSTADRIEIYPYIDACSITINCIIAKTEGENVIIPCSSTGQEITEYKWAFFRDSSIIVDDIPDKTNAIYLEYVVTPNRPRELMREILSREKIVCQIEDDKARIKELETEMEELGAELQKEKEKVIEYQTGLERVTNSRTWKLTAPLRKIKEKIKGC